MIEALEHVVAQAEARKAGRALRATPAPVTSAAQNLNFPLIVKHFNGASSIGMTKDSRVENPEQLRVQALRFIEEYGGMFII